MFVFFFFFFKQKTAYEITHSDWSSDVCSSDLDGIIASGRLGEAGNAYVQQARRVGVPVSIAPVGVPKGTRPSKAHDPRRLAVLSETYGIAAPAVRLVRALAGAAATAAPLA